MSLPQKLVQKIKRLERAVREPSEAVVKAQTGVDTTQASPGAQKLLRQMQRKIDADFGYNVLSYEPALEYKLLVDSYERTDFGGGDMGITMTFASAALMQASGIYLEDSVQPKEGDLEGRMLQVVAIIDSSSVRLDDVPTFVSETDVYSRIILSGVKKAFIL